MVLDPVGQALTFGGLALLGFIRLARLRQADATG
jgi:hypothetical protein